MPSRGTARGFRGVRFQPSGRYVAEISCEGMRHCLGTFETPELTARAYDPMAWRYRRPKSELIFLDAMSQEVAEFLAPQLWIMSRKEEKEDRLVMQQCTTRESDEAATARFAADYSHLVQAEYEFFASRDKKAIEKEDDAGPSVIKKEDEASPSVIKVESESFLELWNRVNGGNDDDK